MHARPNPLARWGEIERTIQQRSTALFLDYDGTLTPIVQHPQVALLSVETRDLVQRLAEQMPVAIVSGRELDDLHEKIGLPSVWYAASHGFEIEGPRGSLHHLPLPELEPAVHGAAAMLRPFTEQIPGALLEDKRFTVGVHYRMVDEPAVPALERAVDEVLLRFPELGKSYGKKVFEIRPRADWNKGRAIEWMLERMKLSDPFPIVLGDDEPDEDAFKAIRDRGISILVAEVPRPTAANWSLANPHQVQLLLERISQLRGSTIAD
jgi:trehalose-phosphatase